MLKIVFGSSTPDTLSLQRYTPATEVWKQATGSDTVDLLQVPWPIPDQSVAAIRLEHIFDNITDTNQWLTIMQEIYRICVDGALIEHYGSKVTCMKNIPLPIEESPFHDNHYLFLNQEKRNKLLQNWQEKIEELKALPLNFNEVDINIVLNKDHDKILPILNGLTRDQLLSILIRYPSAVEQCSNFLCAIHDDSRKFALARVEKIGAYPLQVYPFSEEQVNWVSRSISTKHIWESSETYLILAILNHLISSNEGQTVNVANIGANIGWYTVACALWNSNVHVNAFEPTPQTFEMLSYNIKLNGLEEQVTAHNCALSDSVGECEFFINKNNAGGNSLVNNSISIKNENFNMLSTKVKTDTLDNLYLDKDSKDLPHLIILDVEGHEQKVFDGAKGLFEKGFRPIIITEFAPSLLKLRGECTFYIDMIEKYQYQPYTIINDPTQKTAKIGKIDLQFLVQKYEVLSTPEKNPDCAFLNVMFIPEGVNVQNIKSVV